MTATDARPAHVGILAMEVYVPATFVAQADLERFDGVASGKYTKGLGQEAMSCTGDREDVNSIALTVTAQLLEKYAVRPQEIGRLEVGTETLVDKSKSTKTVLMQLFEGSGNHDVEGATTLNACYGATAALLNALAWVESSAWDGRFALVVATDIAVYAKGPARPTGGCGAVAMLVGPNAPLVVDSRTRATYASHTWDFYKPDPHVEFPTLDGRITQASFIRALDGCYTAFCDKNDRIARKANSDASTAAAPTTIDAFDYALFHSPYNKLVQKSFARVKFLDYRRQLAADVDPESPLLKWRNVSLEETLVDRDLDLAARAVAAEQYAAMAQPCHAASTLVGNCYTASVYFNLASLVNSRGAALADKRLLVFSYGSGCISSMFAVHARRVHDADIAADPRFSLDAMQSRLDIAARLAARTQLTAEEYTRFMELREQFHAKKSIVPEQPVSTLFDGAYYLVGIDDKYQRTYARKCHATSATAVDAKETAARVAGPQTSNPSVYVSGVSAILPGRDAPFNSGGHALDALLRGDNCIEQLSDRAVDAMLARNLVQLIKPRPVTKSLAGAAGGDQSERHRVVTRDESIQVAAIARAVDLTVTYGLPASLVRAMDEPTRLGVAAGLDALQHAGLVRGRSQTCAQVVDASAAWRLPEVVARDTGVIYATSYPTMHATVAEVERFHTATMSEPFELDRKLLFRVLVLANAQLAQITGARGPNTQVNAACAGMTQAVGLARDWIALGRCARVVVIASDVASSATLLPWIGGGFRVLGAASTAPTPETAALPFDVRRNGMLVGSGAAALVLESGAAIYSTAIARNLAQMPRPVRLLATRYANSAFHGASIDVAHVTHELRALFTELETAHGISRDEFAAHGVYYSHETCTNSSPRASCAFAEVSALRGALGDARLARLLIANTKGFTGHPMGVSFEDVVAVEALRRSQVPPVANFKQADPHLACDGLAELRLATTGAHSHRFALRFAAGFGSQVAFSFYALEA